MFVSNTEEIKNLLTQNPDQAAFGTQDELLEFIEHENPDLNDVAAKYFSEIEAFKTGEFELSHGGTSDYYVDMRRVWEYPLGTQLGGSVLAQTAEDEILEDGDRTPVVWGIPTEGMYASLGMSLAGGWPQGYIRDKQKEYGTGNRIETFNTATHPEDSNYVHVVADGVATTGTSVAEGIEGLRDRGFDDDDFAYSGEIVGLVLVDREEGASERLAEHDSEMYSVFTPEDVRNVG
jgi:orotate phosphoribosyltransferase